MTAEVSKIGRDGEQPSCRANRYEIKSSDLPLCCPMPNMTVWDAHPRVYLPIEKTGEASCPYCSATYILIKDSQ